MAPYKYKHRETSPVWFFYVSKKKSVPLTRCHNVNEAGPSTATKVWVGCSVGDVHADKPSEHLTSATEIVLRKAPSRVRGQQSLTVCPPPERWDSIFMQFYFYLRPRFQEGLCAGFIIKFQCVEARRRRRRYKGCNNISINSYIKGCGGPFGWLGVLPSCCCCCCRRQYQPGTRAAYETFLIGNKCSVLCLSFTRFCSGSEQLCDLVWFRPLLSSRRNFTIDINFYATHERVLSILYNANEP